jgi:phosphate transport system substrate-binding protein
MLRFPLEGHMRNPLPRRLVVSVGLCVLVAGIVAMSGCPRGNNSTGSGGGGGASRLSGGGSTFVGPIMKKWSTVFHDKTGVEIDYALKGSGNGVQQMTAKTYAFGCTDAPMNDEELAKAKKEGGDVLHIPLVFGAVVPIYNVPELKDAKEPLKFTGPVLADIYLGKITKWNDPALKALNPGVNLPDRGIIVVRRNEASGTTYTLTAFLAETSPAWKSEMGPASKDPTWWKGAIGKQGNPGVASHVKASEGAIGYVEVDFAIKEGLAYGAVENNDKKFVLGTAEAVTAAAKAAEASIPDNLTFMLINQPGEKSYPICAVVWAVLYVQQPAATGKTLVEFLTWCVHDGQQYTKELSYAPLSEGLVKKIDAKLKSVKLLQ